MDAVTSQANAIETVLVEAMRQFNGSGSMTQAFVAGTVTAARFSLEAVNNTSGRVTVAVPGSAAAVDVPAEVIKQLGSSAVLLLTSFNQSGVSADGTVLRTPPVGVRLFGGAMFSEHHGSFTKRLHVRVSGEPGDHICVFWDEGRKLWNSDGLETIIAQDGSLWCSTPHLTVFGATLRAAIVLPVREAAMAIVCSNVGVVTWEGFMRLRDGDWWRQPAALFLWCLLAGAGVMQVVAWICDQRTLKSGRWLNDRFLLCGEPTKMSWRKKMTTAAFQKGLIETLDKGFDIKVVEGTSQPSIKQRAGNISENSVAPSRSGQIRGALNSRARQFAIGIVRHSVLAELAFRTRTASDDLKRQIVATSSRQIESIRSKLDVETPRVFDGFFRRMHLCRLPLSLFVAAHPFTVILSFSIFIAKSMQSILIASHLLGAAALSALFFSSTGDALSIASPAACATGDNFWRSAAVGMCSGLLTTIPMIFAVAAMKRQFVLRPCWDDTSKRRQLRRWRRKDHVMWTLCFLYSCLCTLFVATFLANVRPDDAQKWLDSLLAILLDDFLFLPLLAAIMYALITAALVCRSPSLVEEVRNDLHMLDHAVTIESTAPMSVSIAAAPWLLDDAVTIASTAPMSVSIAAASWLLDMHTKRSSFASSESTSGKPAVVGTDLCSIGSTIPEPVLLSGFAQISEVSLEVVDETCHQSRNHQYESNSGIQLFPADILAV
jgi:hypothetical protein